MVVPNEYGVIALFQVFVDQILRPTYAAEGVLPADRVKRDAAWHRVTCSILFQSPPESFPFGFEAAGRTDEDKILGKESRH